MDPAPLLLSRADVAALLRKSVKQVSNMQARGQLPSPRRIPGIGVRWSAAAIEAFLARAVAEIEQATPPVPRYVCTAPPVSLRKPRVPRV